MRTRFGLQLTVFVLLTLITSSVEAQQYDVQHFGLREGLSQSKVTKIFQDSRGYIWIGTAGGGVNRFDGKSFVSYSQENGLPGSIIRDIEEDAYGNMYIATSWGGVSKFYGNTFSSITERTRELSQPIALSKDSSNLIWVATENYIGYYDGKNSKVFSRFKETFNESLIDIQYHPTKGLLVLSETRIYQIKNFKLIPFVDLSNHDIYYPVSLVVDDMGSVIVLTEKGEGIVIKQDESIQKTATYHNFLSPAEKELLRNAINLEVDKNGGYWYVIKGKGILHLSGETVTFYGEKNGIKDAADNITELLVDRENNLWIGTNYNGLSKIVRWPFVSFQNNHLLSSPSIFYLRKDGNNVLWTNTDLKNVIAVNTENFEVLSHPIKNETVKDITRYKEAVLVVTEKGIYRSKGTSLEKLPFVFPFESKISSRVLVDRQGNFWVGTAGKGLFKYDAGKYKNPINIDVGNNYVHSLVESRNGNIYVGTGAGLFRVEGNSCVSLNLTLCNSYIGQIAEDTLGNLWLATDNCVSRYDGEKIISYTVENGLSSNTIYLIHVDREGNVWSGTNKGLDKIVFDENGNILSLKNYNNNNGFSGIETNSRGVYEDESGNIYFTTVYGLYIYSLKKDEINPFPPSVHITGVKLFLQNMPKNSAKTPVNWHGVSSSYTLEGNENHLTFYYNAIAHKLPSEVAYQYLLEGFDKGWSPLTNIRQTTYSNLNPGEYTFLVRAYNEDGICSETASLSIKINEPPPPFWQSVWFFILIVVAISYIAFYLIFLRNYRLQRAKMILEEKIRERTKEISKQNEEKAIMLKEIHHRVKNNLQIINSLLNLSSHQITDPVTLEIFQECRSRISSMALIHEKMYEVKDLANIDIREYITQLTENLVKTYQVDKKIDLDLDLRVKSFKLDTLVPLGLIINEAVSNSLKYAFNDRTEGKVFVKIYRDANNMYNFTIGDNGVGLPDDFDWETSPKLGIQLIQILSEQLNGKIEVTKEGGTVYKIVFP